MHRASSLSNILESHIINAQQLAMKKMTLLLGVPHWWMVLENTLEKEIIGAIVGQTAQLIYPPIYMVSENANQVDSFIWHLGVYYISYFWPFF